MKPKFIMVHRRMYIVLMILVCLSCSLQIARVAIQAAADEPPKKVDTRVERICGHVKTKLMLANAWRQDLDQHRAKLAEMIEATLGGIREICEEPKIPPAKPMKLAP